MPRDTFHIIITSESDKSRSLVIRKKLLRNFAISVLLLLTILIFGFVQGIRYFKLRSYTDEVQNQLAQTQKALRNTGLAKADMELEYEQKISDLLREKEELLTGSISELDERSKVIQSVMDHLGVDIHVEEDPGHSGGPFIDTNDDHYLHNLIDKTDRYLDILNKIPLGKPVSGPISSRYGYRSDPLANDNAFHSGVDFRGRIGDDIHATAFGTVKRAGYNKGLGNFILISHGNGYETLFGHMNKILVKKGEAISRGQVIGLIGNTGRSTGSHLHYEIRYNKKTVNPKRYLQIADLSVSVKENYF